jgi:hypothetical protein
LDDLGIDIIDGSLKLRKLVGGTAVFGSVSSTGGGEGAVPCSGTAGHSQTRENWRLRRKGIDDNEKFRLVGEVECNGEK